MATSLCLAACAAPSAIRVEDHTFTAADYLKSAVDTLARAETDADGHRIRAQIETKAALDAINELGGSTRSVPFVGPPTFSVALELLVRSEAELEWPKSQVALAHTRRAEDELRAALALK
jgi:hypothetical protein